MKREQAIREIERRKKLSEEWHKLCSLLEKTLYLLQICKWLNDKFIGLYNKLKGK